MRSCLESNETIKRVVGPKGDRGRFYKVRTTSALAHNLVTTNGLVAPKSVSWGLIVSHCHDTPACMTHAQSSKHAMRCDA